MPDGTSVTFTFFLVAILFMLWAVLNSLIDTMDKHFQDLLHLTKANSAWVQTAHYFGYTIMALPAGLLTRKIGYKGGIIFGLLLVSLGGFWFVPATSYLAVLGISPRCLPRRDGPHGAGNCGKPLHDYSWPERIRRFPHQPRAIVQRLRLDRRPHHCVEVFLRDHRRR